MASQQPSEEMAPRIFPNEALLLLRRDEAIAVDVRPTEAYVASHIAGARSIPLANLQAELSRLPTDKLLIFYCT